MAKRTFTFQITDKMYETLKKEAEEKDRSMGYIVKERLEDSLRKDGRWIPDQSR
jgi:predicted DNA-binding protein